MSIKRKFENWISEYHNPVSFFLCLVIACLIFPWSGGSFAKINSYYVLTDSFSKAPLTFAIQLIIAYLVSACAYHFVDNDNSYWFDGFIPVIFFFVINWIPYFWQAAIIIVLVLIILIIITCHDYDHNHNSIDDEQQLDLLSRKLHLLMKHYPTMSIDLHGYLDKNGLHVSKSQLISLSNNLCDQVDKYGSLARAYHDKCMKK